MVSNARFNRRHKGPLWKEIEAALAQQITDGDLASGEKLPTETELAEQFEVNRHTVRRAIAALVDRGLVSVQQGRGMFVPHLPIDYAIGPTTRFTANILGIMKTPKRTQLKIENIAAGDQVAEALDIKSGDPVVVLYYVGSADDLPIATGNTSFPVSRLPGIEQALRDCSSVTLALRQVGVEDYARKWTRIFADMPSPDDAELLRQSPRRPVLKTEAVDVDLDDRPISFGYSVFAGERVQLTV